MSMRIWFSYRFGLDPSVYRLLEVSTGIIVFATYSKACFQRPGSEVTPTMNHIPESLTGLTPLPVGARARSDHSCDNAFLSLQGQKNIF